MNISNVTSVTNARPSDAPGDISNFARDSKALESALQSGDLAGAQNAFATLQNDVRVANTFGIQPFGQNSAAGKDFQALQTALRAGSLMGARSAFANFIQDLHGSPAQLHPHARTTKAHNGLRAAGQGSVARTLDVTA